MRISRRSGHAGRHRLKSYLGVPILVGDEAIGVISVQSTQQEGRFGVDEQRLLTTIAASVGTAIQNARLYRETHHRAEEMAALVDVAREISATLDTTAVLEQIAEHAINLLDAESSAVYLIQADGRTFRAIVGRGPIADELKADTLTFGQGVIGSVLEVQGGIRQRRHERPAQAGPARDRPRYDGSAYGRAADVTRRGDRRDGGLEADPERAVHRE